MKLFINRDVSASDTCFIIYDELGRQKYHAVLKRSKHNVKKNNIKIDIIDENKIITAKIRKLPIVGVNSFTLKNDKTALTLVIINAASGVQCRFYGNNWHICGDAVSKNFSIIDVDNAVIAVQRKQSGNYYELEISDPAKEVMCLAASLCINLINTVDKLAIQAV